MDSLDHIPFRMRSTPHLGELLASLVALTAKMRDGKYDFEKDGKADFEADLTLAAELSSQAFNEYRNKRDS